MLGEVSPIAMENNLTTSPSSSMYADISGEKIFKYFLLGLAVVAVSDVPNTWELAFIFARGLIGIGIVIALFLPIRISLVVLILILIGGQDIVSSGISVDNDFLYGTASIWQMRLGPINPSWIVFGIISWMLLRVGVAKVPAIFMRLFWWFGTVPVAMGIIYGGFFTNEAVIEVPVDFRFVLMLLGSSLLFLTAFKNEQKNLYEAMAALIGILLARHLMDLIYIAANIGPYIAAGVSRGSEDSAKGAIVLLVFLGVTLFGSRRSPLAGLSVAILASLLMIGYGTRYIWITFMLGVVLLITLLPLRRGALFTCVILIFLVGGIWVLSLVNPQSAAIVFARAKSITEGRPANKFAVKAEYNRISRIDQVRYAEIINVLGSLGRRFAYLWGTGYGGYYEDSDILFPWNLKSSFPNYSLHTGRFYRTHEFFSHFILKYGVLGLFFICTLWFVPGYALVKIFQQNDMFGASQPKMYHAIILAIAAFLPTAMLQTFWSGKGLFLNGIVLASCMGFVKHHTNSVGDQSVPRYAEPKDLSR